MADTWSGSSVDADVDIRRLQEQLLGKPLTVDVRIETVQTQGTSGNDVSFSHDQRMHIRGKMTSDWCSDLSRELNRDKSEKTHVTLVVDRSGSMSGNPFNQVKTALTEIVGQCMDDVNKVIDIILYNHSAETVSFTPQSYKEDIARLRADGSTSFKAAFDMTEAVLKSRNDDSITETVVLFMTDGRDTVSPASKVNEYAKKWARSLKELRKNVTVHVTGFSADHDLQFLTRISQAGSQKGMYRYCEPGDGPQALKDKLEELFDYVSVSGGRPIQFDINLANTDNRLVLTGSHAGMIDGVIDTTEKDGKTELIASTECWIYVDDAAKTPELSVGISMTITKNRVKYTLQIPCAIGELRRTVIADVSGRALWDLAVLSRNTDLLTSQLADAITTSGDVMKLKSRLDGLQAKISSTQVFKAGFDKDTRAQIMEFIKDIQAKIDKLHAMLAQYLRGEAQSVSLLARAQDLRYDAQFSKSRRQRLMDRRVAQNFNVVKTQVQKAAVATEEDLTLLSDQALEFYYCILSMCSVKDILMDENDLENAIGIGLAVARPEHALDDPTSIRVYSISGSLVSRSSIMDALEFKINLEDPLSAHGGFSFDGTWQSELSYATVGAGREPINAWLPLYICPAHWERVKSCLRPSLGYLCTLDPLGYSDNQLDVMFMVLGCMMGQLWENEVGENQLKLIFALQRTCQACVEEFKLETKLTEVVKNFVSSPMGRFRHVVPNLFTLVGYMASLPLSVTRNILGYPEGGGDENSLFSQLWVSFITETLRRASAAKAKLHNTENVVISLLNLLLHGRHSNDKATVSNSSSEEEAARHFGHLSWMLSASRGNDDDLDIPEYDPSKEVAAPEVKVQQSSKVDKAMEVWAQAQCGVITNKNRSEQVANAKKVVKKWVELVREKVGVPADEKTRKVAQTLDAAAGKVTEVPPCSGASASAVMPENTAAYHAREEAKKKAADFDTTAVNSSILEVTAKLLSQLSRHCYPQLSSLPGCVGFLHYLLVNNLNPLDIVSNGGLPPQQWIDGTKQSVSQIFKKMADFKNMCDAAGFVEESNGGDGGMEDNNDGDNRPRGEGQLPQPQKDEAENDNDSADDEEPVEEFMKSNRRTQIRRLVTVPMLLNALGVQGEPIQLIRAMLCQAVSYPSNSQARDATSSGELVDLATPGNAHNYLCHVEANLIERKEAALKKMLEKATWEIANLCMLRAESMWAFIGYLMLTHKERGEGFSALINFILECPGVQGFPCLAEKIKVLLMGKYQGQVVFAKGNSWIPDKKLSKCLENVLGEEVWQDIETELLSQVHIHVYRESDIPNRHGHCNSNPYVPNRIRQILGMPLIDEKIQPRTSVKNHRSLQNKK